MEKRVSVLRLILGVLFVLSLVSTVAFATSVASIGATGYPSLAAAVEAASNGDVIKILSDFSVDTVQYVEKTITIDLNGHTISRTKTGYATSCVLRPRDGGKLTIKDSSSAKTGTIHAIANHEGWAAPIWVKPGGEVIIDGGTIIGENGGKSTYAVYIEGSAANPPKATLNGGKLIAKDANNHASYAVQVSGDNGGTKDTAFFTMNGGVIESDYVGISGNGLNCGTTILIKGGTVSGDNMGVYHPQVGNLTITGGAITGEGTAVGIKAGNLIISGGTLHATGAKAEPTSNNSGMNGTGAALQIESNAGYGIINGVKYPMNIMVSGGKLISDNGCSVQEYLADSFTVSSSVNSLNITGGSMKGEVVFSDGINDNAAVATISGGVFTNRPNDAYIADGVPVAQQGSNFRVGKSAAEIPSTGDADNLLLYGLLMFAALVGMAGLSVVGKRKRV